jgi:hypothetical protein
MPQRRRDAVGREFRRFLHVWFRVIPRGPHVMPAKVLPCKVC